MKECIFGNFGVKYLGHVVGSGKFWVDKDKVHAMRYWPIPPSIKEVQ